jgi:hypothetical protein
VFFFIDAVEKYTLYYVFLRLAPKTSKMGLKREGSIECCYISRATANSLNGRNAKFEKLFTILSQVPLIVFSDCLGSPSAFI